MQTVQKIEEKKECQVKYDFLFIQTEVLYNRYFLYVTSLDFTDESEELIENVLNAYENCLSQLKKFGIEGVLINGIFRNVNTY